MKWIIDRIEGDFAVCEVEKTFLNIPLSALPKGAKEGDVISLLIDNNETNKRKEKINSLMDSLFKD